MKTEHRIRIPARVEVVSTDALRALWAYWSRTGAEPFRVAAAKRLYRKMASSNPELEVQIYEGQELLDSEEGES